jgi:hypothetical protein
MELIEVEVTEDDPIFKTPVISYSPPWVYRSPALTADLLDGADSTDQQPEEPCRTDLPFWEQSSGLFGRATFEEELQALTAFMAAEKASKRK